jgi:two-component system, OmpR family, alkaline phosphatase synthesis response regulator PhoP
MNGHIAPARRLLVAEDDRDMAFALRRNLEHEGYTVLVAHDGIDALDRAHADAPDLILLDVMMPRLDGFRVLRALRASGLEMPVLLLTARGMEPDKVLGFRLGADDYVTKPFGIAELVSRIAAVLRRVDHPRQPGGAPIADRVMVHGLEIDLRARKVRRDTEEIALTPRAFELLTTLARRRGEVVRRDELMRDVWGYASAANSRTLDSHVAELRRKLQRRGGESSLIRTVWKVGYQLDDTETRDHPNGD